MAIESKPSRIRIAEHGMLLVLLALILGFSALTVTDMHAAGTAAGEELAAEVRGLRAGQSIVILTPDNVTGVQLAEGFRKALDGTEHEIVGSVHGSPPKIGAALRRWNETKQTITIFACAKEVAGWPVLRNATNYPGLGGEVRILAPSSYSWPSFLSANNLRNIAQQISIIAILAIGMTLVIITAGIDLSVGSLIGLAAVTTTVLIRDLAGAREASALALLACSAAGILMCGCAGLASGLCIAAFRVPPFIATLAMMLMARGTALTITDSQSVNEVPESFGWLGSGRMLGIPNSVVLMFALYALAHFVMTRTRLGRHIYAIGGNPEAARLAGVPVPRVLLIVYTLCGLLAGLGGVIMASKHKGVEPNFGFMDELTVIAAVVVGGTSLMGGQGKVLGTLVGAFIIAVIRNGMNQIGVPPNPQMIVMGAVILAAVLIDQVRKGNVSVRDLRN